jgi:hypothetical protein
VQTAPQSRPRWAPYFDLSAGASVSGREFDFNPGSLPGFSSTVTPGLHLDLTLYPMASFWRIGGGVLSGLGVGATFDRPFWPATPARSNPGQSFATGELRVEGGLRWRFTLYKPTPRPELVILVGGGLHQFAVAKAVSMTGAITDAGAPDVSYAFFSGGATFRLSFGERVRLLLGGTYQQVLDSGPIGTAAEYGTVSTVALRGSGGLEFFLWRGLKLSALGYYERYVLQFTGRGMRGAASGAIDQYYGGQLALGYEL